MEMQVARRTNRRGGDAVGKGERNNRHRYWQRTFCIHRSVSIAFGTNNSDYKVLLVASSFMTPLESRQSQNVNKVRMFTKENFSKPECDEKWDRIKIACKQPFNKFVQYGLSFITLHTSNEKPSAPVQAHIGQFVLRPESPDNLSAGSLFEKRKELQQEDKLEVKLTGAAAIREAA
ncbi:hypothetical protein NQ318_005275 [Aromia moschata]|uniref:DNA-repair protein Xrcc1 N-terminal domain-containing protein n=1 Tax=Aromia moschata TaxID=1265417 RepID=A0AAV8Y0X5_9CUCU|nr:hypothetical protein NQ318_005275 [Aromia moschata]